MHVRADENTPPRLVKALELIALKPSWKLDHVRDFEGPSADDEDWIFRFAKDGGSAVLSCDRRIIQRPYQLRAITESGQVGIFLADRLGRTSLRLMAAAAIYWWGEIEIILNGGNKGTCWEIPSDFTRRQGTPLKKLFPFEQQAQRRRST